MLLGWPPSEIPLLTASQIEAWEDAVIELNEDRAKAEARVVEEAKRKAGGKRRHG